MLIDSLCVCFVVCVHLSLADRGVTRKMSQDSNFQQQLLDYAKRRKETLNSSSSFSSGSHSSVSLSVRPRSISESIGLSSQVSLLTDDFGVLLLQVELANCLRMLMPPLTRLCLNWRLCYSSERDGFSLRTMYSNCAKEGSVRSQYLLVIQAEGQDHVFGAFLTTQPAPHWHHYGSGEVFLWKQSKPEASKDSVLRPFFATGKNEYWMMSEPGFFAVGCSDGAFGLWLDESMRKGNSKSVATFDNEPLVGVEGDFVCKAIELWIIDH